MHTKSARRVAPRSEPRLARTRLRGLLNPLRGFHLAGGGTIITPGGYRAGFAIVVYSLVEGGRRAYPNRGTCKAGLRLGERPARMLNPGSATETRVTNEAA